MKHEKVSVHFPLLQDAAEQAIAAIDAYVDRAMTVRDHSINFHPSKEQALKIADRLEHAVFISRQLAEMG